MRFLARARHMPARIATGAFILNSGISKLNADEETAKQYHGMATGTYPFLSQLEPRQFTKLLANSEIALGAALLLPFVPTALAAAGLTAFSGGLLGLYLRTPGMREAGSLRPTADGMPIAKDVWMLGIGIGFLVDALTDDQDG
ncbi:hypothetical protein [Fodinicola acaciae]|uniref:hypothetical protein n=1 Tax=Fodinicola acaciae TaxID=2681555 RepID=UPI0013D32F3F|nr:hypothetical protein [Fodinicola acaciae]